MANAIVEGSLPAKQSPEEVKTADPEKKEEIKAPEEKVAEVSAK